MCMSKCMSKCIVCVWVSVCSFPDPLPHVPPAASSPNSTHPRTHASSTLLLLYGGGPSEHCVPRRIAHPQKRDLCRGWTQTHACAFGPHHDPHLSPKHLLGCIGLELWSEGATLRTSCDFKHNKMFAIIKQSSSNIKQKFLYEQKVAKQNPPIPEPFLYHSFERLATKTDKQPTGFSKASPLRREIPAVTDSQCIRMYTELSPGAKHPKAAEPFRAGHECQ
jgi:hypothetical protein